MENKLKFLIIDDNEIDGLITAKLLEIHLQQTDVHYTESCEKGLKWIKTNRIPEEETLIILLDIRMPDMDGFEFLEIIDKLDETLTKNIQVFMLSSTLYAEDYQLAEKNKFVKTLLSKPLPVKELMGFIS